ncbi:MAG TPA: rRNA maturation RNase YbeY [Negativicutes bacterium]|nr:rRNA maturation RNase YbeY [Negativicutes bacterium]
MDKAFFTGVAKKVLKGENRLKENVSVAFVTPEEIQKLNNRYRKKDKPTDVLSFARVSDFKDECGEVVICPAYIKEATKSSALSLKREMARSLIHGLLHNLGYDHEVSKEAEAKMVDRESYYFSRM